MDNERINLILFLLERKYCYPSGKNKDGKAKSKFNVLGTQNPFIKPKYELADFPGASINPDDILKEYIINNFSQRFSDAAREWNNRTERMKLQDNSITDRQKLISQLQQRKADKAGIAGEITDTIEQTRIRTSKTRAKSGDMKFHNGYRKYMRDTWLFALGIFVFLGLLGTASPIFYLFALVITPLFVMYRHRNAMYRNRYDFNKRDWSNVGVKRVGVD
jgi:hypothetical protein